MTCILLTGVMGMASIALSGEQAKPISWTPSCTAPEVLAAHGVAVLAGASDSTPNPVFSPEGLRSVMEILSLGASEEARAAIAAYYRGAQDEVAGQRFDLSECAWKVDGHVGGVMASTVDHVFVRDAMPTRRIVDLLESRSRPPRFHDIPGEGFADWLRSVNREIESDSGALIANPLDLPRSTIFAIANVLWFDAPWRFPFDTGKTRLAPFYLSDGSVVQARMMEHDARDVRVVESEGFIRVFLLYADHDHYMQLVMPRDAESDVKSWLDRIDPATLSIPLDPDRPAKTPDLGRDGATTRAIVFLPRFDAAAKIDISDHMTVAGFGWLYRDSSAFVGLTGQRLRLDRITQDVRVITEEAGTKAAAVTTVLAKTSLPLHPPKKIRFDRPFLYVIGQGSSGALIAMGVVGDPSDRE